MGLDELSSIIMHLIAEDTVEEQLNMEGRIECELNPDAELPLNLSTSVEHHEDTTLRMTRITDKDVILNEENFGRIVVHRYLQKCHVENVYDKDGENFVIFAPDVDHWNVKYYPYTDNNGLLSCQEN